MSNLNKSKEQEKDAFLSQSTVDSAKKYSENLVMNGRQGHGFAAEKANDLYDNFSGKDAKIVGSDNKKNGADRVVDGKFIQTKYCSTGSKCVAEAFENGKWRYWNGDGTPMMLEVPPECYDEALAELQKKIIEGRLEGVTDPKEAEKILTKGRFSYAQAKNIAKFGTVESLTFDVANGIKLSCQAMGLTSVLTFAIGIWQGKSIPEALDEACFSAICVGGIALLTHVSVAQAGKSGLDKTISPITKNIGRIIPKDVKKIIVKGLNPEAKIGNTTALNNKFNNLFKSNLVTAVVTVTVLSIDDFLSLFNSEISCKQAFKNIAKTSAAVAGGIGGAALAGFMLGSVAPGAGNVVCAVAGAAGAIIGGGISKKGGDTLLDAAIDDDSVMIGDIIQNVFCNLSNDYLLSELEFKRAASQFQSLNLDKFCKSAVASGNSYQYIEESIRSIIEAIVEQRRPIFLPSKKKIQKNFLQIVNESLNEGV